MAVLSDAQKQQLAARYYQIYQAYQQSNDAAAYMNAKAQFEQSLSDEEKAYYEQNFGFKGQENPESYWKRIQKLAGGGEGADTGQLMPEGQQPQSLGQQVTKQMSDFLNYLSQPVDFSSPFAKQILRQAEMNAYRKEAGAGARGGLANLNVQQAYMGAAAGLEQQRQANLMQALGMGSGRDIGLQNVDLARQAQAEQQYQFDVGQAYKQYQQNMENQMAGLGLVGGAGGALIGGLATGGSPAGIAGGYQAGSRALAGLGGASTPAWSPPARL